MFEKACKIHFVEVNTGSGGVVDARSFLEIKAFTFYRPLNFENHHLEASSSIDTAQKCTNGMFIRPLVAEDLLPMTSHELRMELQLL